MNGMNGMMRTLQETTLYVLDIYLTPEQRRLIARTIAVARRSLANNRLDEAVEVIETGICDLSTPEGPGRSGQSARHAKDRL